MRHRDFDSVLAETFIAHWSYTRAKKEVHLSFLKSSDFPFRKCVGVRNLSLDTITYAFLVNFCRKTVAN